MEGKNHRHKHWAKSNLRLFYLETGWLYLILLNDLSFLLLKTMTRRNTWWEKCCRKTTTPKQTSRRPNVRAGKYRSFYLLRLWRQISFVFLPPPLLPHHITPHHITKHKTKEKQFKMDARDKSMNNIEHSVFNKDSRFAYSFNLFTIEA